MWQLLVGYAIGTAQILGLEWFRDRRAHARGIRLLHAEFQHLNWFGNKFNWTHQAPPVADDIPVPPSVSSKFFDTVAAMDWRLTDEHQADNSIVAIMSVADGCENLQRYHKMVRELVDTARMTTDSVTKQKALRNAIDAAQRYDAEVDVLLYVVDSAVRDMERRLGQAGLLKQVGRAFKRLPHGTNPAPVARDDPRVRQFAEERARRKAVAGP